MVKSAVESDDGWGYVYLRVVRDRPSDVELFERFEGSKRGIALWIYQGGEVYFRRAKALRTFGNSGIF